MISQMSSLFDLPVRYCLDTNVVVSFLRGSDDEFYGRDIFPQQWHLIERLISSGEMVAPRQVERELAKWDKSIEAMPHWLRECGHMFRDVSDTQLSWAKRIVNVYPDYGRNDNYLGDLEVMTLAATLGVPVITLEQARQEPTTQRPKIPEVCQEFGIGCVSLAGFLRRENMNS